MKTNHFLELFNVVKDYRFLIQMIKDKAYSIPLARKLAYCLLGIYIIIPFDFIPGIIPIVGMVDDLGALTAIVGILLYEITSYRDFLEGTHKSSDAPRTNEGRRVSEETASLEEPRETKTIK